MKIEVYARKWSGWSQHSDKGYTICFNGYVLNGSVKEFINDGLMLLESDRATEREFDQWLRGTQGHFSFVVVNGDKLICGVDHVKSIPLFYSLSKSEIKVSNYAPDINNSIGINKYNRQAALEISMSGYTIGSKTLHPEISQLSAGELLIARDGKVEVRRYYRYSPWKVLKRDKSKLKQELTDVSRQVLEDMVENAGERQFVVPLSAGNDSRFVASGLKELGVKDVFCFSYGIINNFEVKTAKQVAAHLEYPWCYVPLSIATQKKAFAESEFEDFWKFTDTLSNHPVLIDYSAVKSLKESGKISEDAIFVNGNSGDFITGGHLLPSSSNGNSFSVDQLVKSIISKHFSLWGCLKTKDNISKIEDELVRSIRYLMEECDLSLSHLTEVGESIEWDGRQSKIVTTTQRSYEFHGYEWRLPMWDPIYMNFWEGVEKKYKLNQSLYIETLIENNWGGVWKGITVNDYQIASDKLKLVRNITKLFFVLLGKDAWHRFDKRVFSYFYDETAATAIVPYRNAVLDWCGARNRNSWIVKRYLNEKEIEIK